MQAVNVVVTGARGFIGKNLCAALRTRSDVRVSEFDVGDPPDALDRALAGAAIVYHLAGVNRPRSEDEFTTGNVGVTAELCGALERAGRAPKVVLTSSIHAVGESAYGRSKREAEATLERFCARTGAEGVVHRLKNLFGKWCRPNYNSVTATFCHNVARGLPLEISDRSAALELTYVDDVVASFVGELDAPPRPGFRHADPLPSHRTTLGELADLIRSFGDHRRTLVLADYATPFVRALYATYLTYVEPAALAYPLQIKSDARGSLAEVLKSPHFGQIFVSRTKPGITRGNHYHHTKAEKFMVVQGEAVVRLRHILGGPVVEHRVRGDEFRVVDIAPGFTHSIENVGTDELVTLFWADEVFDPGRADTVFEPVIPAAAKDGAKP